MATTSSLVSCQVLLFRFSFLSFLFTFWHWPICGLTAGLSRQLAPTVPHLLHYFWDNTKAFPNPIWFDLGGWFNHIYWFLCRPWKKLMGNIFFFTSLPNSPKVEFWPKLGINKIYNQKRCHIIFGLLFSAVILWLLLFYLNSKTWNNVHIVLSIECQWYFILLGPLI